MRLLPTLLLAETKPTAASGIVDLMGSVMMPLKKLRRNRQLTTSSDKPAARGRAASRPIRQTRKQRKLQPNSNK